MSLSEPEREVVDGVRRALNTAVGECADSAAQGEWASAERWARLAFGLVEVLEERGVHA